MAQDLSSYGQSEAVDCEHLAVPYWIGPRVKPEEPQEESHEVRPTTSPSGLLRSQLPKLARFLHRRCGPVLRARESVSDLAQSVCRELIERWNRTGPPD